MWKEVGPLFGEIPKGVAARRLQKVPIRLASHPREYLGHDLTGKLKVPNMFPPKQRTEDNRDERASMWQLDFKDPKERKFYLRVLHGELNGWYLDFEEAEPENPHLWKAKLSPKPGKQSLLQQHFKRN
jgi:hypothetical protein